MSSRLEKRFVQAKSEQLADPILLSGLSPSLIHELTDLKTVRNLVDAVIRAQWIQIHPDHASSPVEKERREKAKGELEGALQVLKSAEFEGCLRRFRNKFPAFVEEATCSILTSFSGQFVSLDTLLQKEATEIPLRALRDVTIELFDLPALALAISQELSVSLEKKTPDIFLSSIRRSPETITIDSLLTLRIGSFTLDFDETRFGKELSKLISSRLEDSKDSDLKALQPIFNPLKISEEGFFEAEKHFIQCLANASEKLAAIWNTAVDELLSTAVGRNFRSSLHTALRAHAIDVEVAKLQRHARSLPLKRLYIDSSGRFHDGKESGSIHSARKVESADQEPARAMRLMIDESLEDESAVERTTQESLVDEIIFAAFNLRKTCSISNALFRPDGEVMNALKEPRVQASRSGPSFTDEGRISKSISRIEFKSFSLPGTELTPEDFFYSAENGYPPSLPTSLLTSEPTGLPADQSALYLISSHRSGEDGEGRFYLEGFVHRIYRGK